MRISKEEMCMQMAEVVSKRSTCERLHVGAIITDEHMTNIFAFGYNGNYAGGPNTCDSDQPGGCGCLHAEANALAKPCPVTERVLFVTDSPCLMCSKLIINSGVKKVYFDREYRITDGLELLSSAGIKTIKVNMQKQFIV